MVSVTLASTTGTWSNTPKYHTFQWRRCNDAGGACVNIGAATNPRYTVTPADVGSTLRVVVAASNDSGVSYARTDETALVSRRAQSAPVVSVRPTITGIARQGVVLTVSAGTWTNAPTHYAFQWRRCNASGNACVSIDGANDQRYVVGAADVGWTLRAVVAASNEGGITYARTDETALVSPMPLLPQPVGPDS